MPKPIGKSYKRPVILARLDQHGKLVFSKFKLKRFGAK